MRYVCLFMTLVFALFAYVQGNDLDQYNTQLWYVWIVFYGMCSALSLLSAFVALPRRIYVSFSLSFLVASFVRFTDVTPGKPLLFNENNPAGNEAGGLLVIAVWFGVLVWKHKSLAKGAS